MNKKIILLFIFSLINNSLLYGEDNTALTKGLTLCDFLGAVCPLPQGTP